MKYYELKNELKNKERNINDLARYIKNIPDKNPNYSLFLGAGCSVTSGIKSGEELVSGWRKEIFDSLFPGTEYDIENAKSKLTTKFSAWYDPRNEYSSLFEKKYDLPRQRRMFVESCVAGKNPSIGYAYLIKLIENSYFNTVFTTNFDDLINEAFYRFSEIRPILCAHDSSINSITVTSKRPKVIKLHGDFLFDDLKSTIRETESLENNMRNKLIEFSKDFGLIVIGYGGYDRSILDVLTFLLKNEEYFKNGIYWCIRENDEIGTELHKLLWKDKVFFVKIDGFDELFAELNSLLLKNHLPLDTSVLTNKSQELLSGFEENLKKYKTSNLIIKKDIAEIQKRMKDEEIKLFLKGSFSKEMQEEKENKQPNIEEQLKLIKLSSYLDSGDFDSFDKLKNELNISQHNNLFFQKEVLNLKAQYFILKGLMSNARNIYKEIFNRLDKDPKYLMKAAAVLDDKEGVDLLNESIELDHNNYEVYLFKGNIIYKEYLSLNLKAEDKFNEACNLFRISIEKNPSIKNYSWNKLFSAILYKNRSNKLLPDECKDLLEKAKLQNDNHVNYIKMLLRKEEFEGNDSFIMNSNDFFLKKIEQVHGYAKYQIKKLQLNWMLDKKLVTDFDLMLSSFKEEYIYDDEIVIIEAKFWGNLRGNFTNAIKILESWLDNDFSREVLELLFYYYLYEGEYRKAKDVFVKYFEKDKEMKKDLLSYQNKWEDIKVLTDKFLENDRDAIIERAFVFMKLNDFNEAQNILKNALDINKWIDEVMIINYEICNFFLKHKVNKDRLSKFLNSSDNCVKMGANILLNKIPEAKTILVKEIEYNYEKKEQMKNWVLFELKGAECLRKVFE